MNSSKVTAVLFVKDLQRVTVFYSAALGMKQTFGDRDHSVLDCRGFKLIVHQIPKHIADGITIDDPPQRREEGAIRLDYPVENLDESRRRASDLGGGIDDSPPAWADSNSAFFLGYDPEGNQFGVSQGDR